MENKSTVTEVPLKGKVLMSVSANAVETDVQVTVTSVGTVDRLGISGTLITTMYSGIPIDNIIGCGEMDTLCSNRPIQMIPRTHVYCLEHQIPEAVDLVLLRMKNSLTKDIQELEAMAELRKAILARQAAAQGLEGKQAN